MVDVDTLSIVLTGTGLMIALTYYALQIRNQNRTRQAQLYMQVFSQLSSTEKWREYLEILELEWDDYIDFQRKHGVLSGNLDTYAKITSLWWTYVTVGNLVSENLIDIKSVYSLLDSMPIAQWKKWEPIILELRNRIEESDAYAPFEYLARELQQLKDDGYVEEIKIKFSLDS
jgi:hypothetical protein